MTDWPMVVAGLMAANVRSALDADMVFAAWVDEGKPQGVGYVLIKGEALLHRFESGNVSSIEMSLVRVDNEAEALALLKKVRAAGNGGK